MAGVAAGAGGGGEGELGLLRASEERAAWLKDDYHKMFKSARSEQAERLFKKLSSMVPDDFLRRRLVPRCMSPLCCRSIVYISLLSFFLGPTPERKRRFPTFLA